MPLDGRSSHLATVLQRTQRADPQSEERGLMYADVQGCCDAMSTIVFGIRPKSLEDHLADKEVHVSSLVKDTALNCAKKILDKSVRGGYDEDDVNADSYWGVRGEAMGEAISPDADYREITVRIPLDDGWTLVGTLDALYLLLQQRFGIGEWKFHNAPKEGLHDLNALKQAGLLLAMLWEAYKDGQRDFPASPYEYDAVNAKIEEYERRIGVEFPRAEPGSLDLHLGDGLRPGGVFCRILGTWPDQAMAKGWEPTESVLRETVRFYRDKANSVAKTCDTEDFEHARSWDRQYPQELVRRIDTMFDPPAEARVVLMEYDHAREIKKWAEAKIASLRPDIHLNWARGDIKEGEGVLVKNDGELDYRVRVRPPRNPGYIPDFRFINSPNEGWAPA